MWVNNRDRTEDGGNQEKLNRQSFQSPESCNVTSALPLPNVSAAGACKKKFASHNPQAALFRTCNVSDSFKISLEVQSIPPVSRSYIKQLRTAGHQPVQS